jgi:hypothetical protein
MAVLATERKGVGSGASSNNFSKFVKLRKNTISVYAVNTQISSPFKSVKKWRRNPRHLYSKKSAK